MRERAILGGVSGIAGSVFCTLYEVIAESLKITDRSFLDYTATLVANKVYPGTLGFIVSFLAQAAVGLMFGVLLVYLTKTISSRYYLLKGLGYGFTLWLLLSGFGIIFRLPAIMDIPPSVSLFDLTNSLLYGLSTAYIIKILSHRFSETGN